MNYLIRATTKRMWYVEKYLIPELESQGCGKLGRNIKIFQDDSGNLSSFMNMCKYILSHYKSDDFVWVLQDDVYPCDNFHYMTNKYARTEVNGFCSGYDNIHLDGIQHTSNSWLSFQCKNFRVDIIELFVKWFFENHEKEFGSFVRANKYDDSIYYRFEKSMNDYILNLNPNIVEHVDYLIGGSIVNKNRTPEEAELMKSQNFEDVNKIKALEEKLNENKA